MEGIVANAVSRRTWFAGSPGSVLKKISLVTYLGTAVILGGIMPMAAIAQKAAMAAASPFPIRPPSQVPFHSRISTDALAADPSQIYM
jgi:hypothetical protein